jgi:type IV pilus assembly protein PilM
MGGVHGVFEKSVSRIGLDIEQTLLAGVQVKGGHQSQVLTHAALQTLPEGLVAEGEVIDVGGLAGQLKSFWKRAGFRSRRVLLGVANQKIVVRAMEFPLIDDKELRAAIEFQAQEAIPIPVEEAVLDYQVMNTYTAEDGSTRQRILLVAAQRDMVRQFVEVARKANLQVDGIDLQAFALARALAEPHDLSAEAPVPGAVAMVNIGSGVTNLVVVQNDAPQFTRVISLGSESMIETLATDCGVDTEEAWRLAVTVGLRGGTPPPADPTATREAGLPEDISPELAEQIRVSLENSCETFADEIRRSIDYYHSQTHEAEIGRLLITGDGSLARHLPAYLSQALHLEASLGDPLRRLSENKSKLSEAELGVLAPRLAIAVGLALEGDD